MFHYLLMYIPQPIMKCTLSFLQMFDHIAEAEINLRNRGKVGFDFNAISMDRSSGKRPLPGIPVMIPHAGHIEAHSELRLQVKFLLGIPSKFHKSFEVIIFIKV